MSVTFGCHNDLGVLLAFSVWMPEKLDTLKSTELPHEQRPSDVPPDIQWVGSMPRTI